MLPVNVLMTDLVSVWKHSMWILCTGLVVFSISEQGLSNVRGRRRETASWIWIIITTRCTELSALKGIVAVNWERMQGDFYRNNVWRPELVSDQSGTSHRVL